MRRRSLLAVLAVAGPGILAGLSDDDPAGITTYSILGAEHGYRCCGLLLSTVALALFHDVALRMGVVTGQGLTGLVRERYGVRIALVAARRPSDRERGHDVRGVRGRRREPRARGLSRYVSVPVAAVLVATLVIRGSFRRVEHALLALGTLFASYIAAGFLAGPDWGAAATGLIVPTPPRDSRRHADHGRRRRDDACALGPRVHPVLRRATNASGPPTCAGSASTSSSAH